MIFEKLKYLLNITIIGVSFIFFDTGNIYSSPTIDSLENLLNSKTGIEKALILNKIASTYDNILPELRINYAKEALQIGEQFKNDSIIVRANLNLGLGFVYKSEHENALVYFLTALEQSKSLKDTIKMTACLNNIGSIYRQFSDYPNALKYLKTSLDIKEKNRDTVGFSKVLNNIGAIYSDWLKFDEAIEFLKKALAIKLLKDTATLPNTLKDLGITYFLKGISFLQKINTFSEEFPIFNEEWLKNDSSKKYFQFSQEYFNKAIEIYKSRNDKLGVAQIKKKYSKYYVLSGKFGKCTDHV